MKFLKKFILLLPLLIFTSCGEVYYVSSGGRCESKIKKTRKVFKIASF